MVCHPSVILGNKPSNDKNQWTTTRGRTMGSCFAASALVQGPLHGMDGGTHGECVGTRRASVSWSTWRTPFRMINFDELMCLHGRQADNLLSGTVEDWILRGGAGRRRIGRWAAHLQHPNLPAIGCAQSILMRDSQGRDSFMEDALLSAWD